MRRSPRRCSTRSACSRSQAILFLVYRFVWHSIHVFQASVLIPGIAAQVAVSPTGVHFDLPDNNGGGTIAWWVGVIVMLGYGVVFGVVGTAILRKRDIS